MAIVSDSTKRAVEAKARDLIESYLRPNNVKPPPPDAQFNYIVDVTTKWHGKYFYFSAKYHCPGPNAITPSFESKYARLEYRGKERFALSFVRHTGEWIELYPNLTIDECLSPIKDEPFFQP